MNYNDIFRVFDNGGETVDRYTVYLRSNPEQGALGLSDNPSHPQGFSQWGDFDIDVVEKNNNEISFDKLPPNVQKHVIERFEVTEGKCKTCVADSDTEKCECDGKCSGDCECGCSACNEMTEVREQWKKIVYSMLDNDKDGASTHIGKIIKNKMSNLINHTSINEFSSGLVKIVGDDVIVNGKKIGEIENDLDDHSRGIVLKLENGEEHEFDDAPALYKFIVDTFRLKEDVQFVAEASIEQKYIVSALRQLAKKLNIIKPRFRSLNGRAGFVEMSVKNWQEDEIPNSLREKIVSKIFRTVPRNFSDVNYGNVNKSSVALTISQWIELLKYYGIDAAPPEQVTEGKNNLELYYDQYSAALEAARNMANSRGFEIDESDWFNKVSTGPRKPFPGESNSIVLPLSKDGKLTKRTLAIYVYGMPSGRYELTAYIS